MTAGELITIALIFAALTFLIYRLLRGSPPQ